MSRRRYALAFTLALSGCAIPGDVPSLSPRPIEKLAAAEPESAAATPLPDTTPLSPEAAAALADAEAGEAKFRTELAAAEQAVSAARTAPTGSEAWVVAQQALSRAHAARVAASSALATLDAARVGAGAAPSAALDAARDRVAALGEAQGSALRALEESLPQP